MKETCLDGPALCFSNHGGNGETILRTGKVVKNCGDIHGMWNYSKLCYNTKYPWEAPPHPGQLPGRKRSRLWNRRRIRPWRHSSMCCKPGNRESTAVPM